MNAEQNAHVLQLRGLGSSQATITESGLMQDIGHTLGNTADPLANRVIDQQSEVSCPIPTAP